MKNKLILIAWIAVLGISLGGCSSSEKSDAPASAADEIAAEADFEENFDDFGDEEFSEESSDENLAQEDFSEEDFESFGDEEFNEEVAEEELGGEEFFAEEGAGEEISESDLNFEEAPSEELAITEESSPAESSELEEFNVAVEAPSNELTTPVDTNTSGSAKVIGLDFLSNQNGGTIMISTDQPVSFRQRKNLATGQYIIEVDGVNLPAKYQRPYDTREFGGAIGLFQAYQEQGSNTARFVIQLNGDVEPLVSQEGNALMVLASTREEVPEVETVTEVAMSPEGDRLSTEAVDIDAVKKDEKLLGEKTIEDFLVGNTNYYGKKINIELVDTDILRVFDIIAEQSNLNIVVSQEVKGNITLKLRDIPWDQALMVVLQSKQLGYVKNGNILRIAPLAKLEEESKEARKVIEAQKKLQPVKVRIFPISYAQAADIVTQVNEFLTPERGKAKEDKRTNSVIVTDTASVLEKVAKLIKSLDTETPQVLMEAKFVEATETFTKDINMNILSQSFDNTNSTTSTFYGIDSEETTVPGGFFVTFNNLANLGNLTARLALFEKRNLARVISSPRVVGLNNEEAKIVQTNQVLDVTQVLSGESSNVTTTFTPKDVKTELSIKPQITAEGSILMDMAVQRDVAGAQEKAGDATSRPINTREVKTKVLVPNGDTVVIGGVYSFDNSKVKSRIPYFSDVPILGTLFKGETSEYAKSELMIFVTPRVLNIDKAFNSGTILGEGSEEADSKTF
jgi:type IV pilus assembly protein PilQ